MTTEVPPMRLTLSAAEAAKAIGISRTKFYSEVARGKVPQPMKIGRRSVWPIAELTRYIEERCAARQQTVGAA